MGVINAENMISFKSSDALYARIKKRLSSFDAMNLIDDADFHDHVKFIIERLGVGVYKECEAIIDIVDHKAKLPDNFKTWFAGFKCTPDFENVKSINEQKPWIYYIQTEIGQECNNSCCISCVGEGSKTKIVLRTFVNGDPTVRSYGNPIPLVLSPSVKRFCESDCRNPFDAKLNEITIDDNRIIHAQFDDSIYLQYYGLPIDEYGLPMIPEIDVIEKAIEYYIYSQLFEEFYWNSTVPNIANMLADARQKFDFYMAEALYYVKLPSFAKMVQVTRKFKNNKKFYQFVYDKTRV
jgi:hypothetical protein